MSRAVSCVGAKTALGVRADARRHAASTTAEQSISGDASKPETDVAAVMEAAASQIRAVRFTVGSAMLTAA